jgi:hypothetical protein
MQNDRMDSLLAQPLRLITLWIAWLLAMLFHVDLGLMPLFHGQSPEIHSHVGEKMLPVLFGAMLGYFLLPVIAIVLIAYAATAPVHSRGSRLGGLAALSAHPLLVQRCVFGHECAPSDRRHPGARRPA